MSNTLGWLQDNLVGASNIARAGPAIKANGERYGAASTHFAMLLCDILEDVGPGTPFASLEQSVLAISGTAEAAATAMKALLQRVPVLMDARRFHAPSGMYDLPQILAACYYARKASTGFKADETSEYQRYLRRMQWLLLMVNVLYMAKEDDEMYDKLERAIDTAAPRNFEIAERIYCPIKATGRDLVPTPAACVAATGVSLDPPMDNAALVAYVRGVNRAIADDPSRAGVKEQASPQVQFLAHMRLFLIDTAERLALAVLPCDRAPVVAPWYAATIAGVRTYAHVLAKVLGGDGLRDPAAFTAWALMAMSNSDITNELEVPSPADLLFNAPTKSMYVKMAEQDGPWWVLLRATLSCITVGQARATAQILVKAATTLPETVRTAALFCVMMHTQTGMAIVGYREGESSYPIASLIARAKDPVCGQSALELVANTLTGTSDLSSLATDDLAFTAVKRHEHAWMQEVALRVGQGVPNAPPSNPREESVVAPFLEALEQLALGWMPYVAGDELPDEDDMSADEMEAALMRVSASQSSVHNGRWLAMAFTVTCKLEEWMQGPLGEPPLIQSSLKASSDPVLGANVTRDEAALRNHFCLQAEHALTGARKGGMWTGNHHLVLVAWLCVNRSETDDSDPGVRVFARAITSHTIPDTEIQASAARLITEEWKHQVKRRGDDSVVECAREFERALHARNMDAIAQAKLGVDEIVARWKFAGKTVGDEDLALAAKITTAAPTMPTLPKHSAWRHHAASLVGGPALLDPTAISDLDEATTVALKRLRLAQQDKSMHSSLLYAQTGFADGSSVAVVGVPMTDEDMRPLRQRAAREGSLVTRAWQLDRTELLRRMAMFQGDMADDE